MYSYTDKYVNSQYVVNQKPSIIYLHSCSADSSGGSVSVGGPTPSKAFGRKRDETGRQQPRLHVDVVSIWWSLKSGRSHWSCITQSYISCVCFSPEESPIVCGDKIPFYYCCSASASLNVARLPAAVCGCPWDMQVNTQSTPRPARVQQHSAARPHCSVVAASSSDTLFTACVLCNAFSCTHRQEAGQRLEDP